MLGVVAIGLGGCSTTPPHDALEAPIVEMTNIDPVRYYKDLGECVQAKKTALATNGQPFTSPVMITDCMKSRGYVILSPRG